MERNVWGGVPPLTFANVWRSVLPFTGYDGWNDWEACEKCAALLRSWTKMDPWEKGAQGEFKIQCFAPSPSFKINRWWCCCCCCLVLGLLVFFFHHPHAVIPNGFWRMVYNLTMDYLNCMYFPSKKNVFLANVDVLFINYILPFWGLESKNVRLIKACFAIYIFL